MYIITHQHYSDDNEQEVLCVDSDADENIDLDDAIAFANKWDPLNHDSSSAPDSWCFPGFMAFVCFGPTSRHYAVIFADW